MLAMLGGGFAGGWYGGDQFQAILSVQGSSRPDGAAANSFWLDAYIDVPGVKVADLHCGGTVRRIVELGLTGPNASCGRPRRMPGDTDLAESFRQCLARAGADAVWRLRCS